jgi:hypothetical protein
MIINEHKFYLGLGLIGSFFIIFCLIFSPIFNGQNGLEYLDDLYNSISKGSAYYIPKLQEEIAPHNGKKISFNMKMTSSDQAEKTAKLFEKSGASVNISNASLHVEGDLGKILVSCLNDADLMYFNQGKDLADKYGYPEKQILYNWWFAAKLMDKDLKNQKLFQEAKIVTTVQKKGLETSYNYYKIEPQKISDKWGIVIFSLIFYVIYTMWYGFGIMYLFEGWGMQLEH